MEQSEIKELTMVNYRRNKLKGGTYFFTLATRDRTLPFLTKYFSLLKDAMRNTGLKKPYKTIAIVVLPEHLHVIWELPENDDDYASRWRSIKSYFSRRLAKIDKRFYKNQHGEYNIWQRRYWEHTIKDEYDLNKHIDYIHYNPVKHGLVSRVCDWPYSSFHGYVRQGLLDKDWADEKNDLDNIEYGE